MGILPIELLEKISRDFPDHERDGVVALLSRYGREPHEQERNRVLMDILILADGNSDEVRELVSRAKRDYRDILMWAEHGDEAKLDTPEKKASFDEMCREFGVELQSSGREVK